MVFRVNSDRLHVHGNVNFLSEEQNASLSSLYEILNCVSRCNFIFIGFNFLKIDYGSSANVE